MRTIKVRKVIKLLQQDGWEIVRVKVDHWHFKCRDKPGTVTLSGKLNDDVDPFLLNSIWKQAGWK